MSARLLLALPLCAAFVACRSALPSPGQGPSASPWSSLERGTIALALRPGFFSQYQIDGHFTSVDQATGLPLSEDDDGDLKGRLGVALGAELFLAPRWSLFFGGDYRKYDVDGLNPIEDLDVDVEDLDSLQYFVALRHLFPPNPIDERFRPFAQMKLVYNPGVDLGFEVDLSQFGSSNLNIDSESDPFWMAGASTGFLYALSERWILELGLLYEFPLEDVDVDLSFDIAGSTVPLEAELEPGGFVGYWGISYVF